MTSRDPSTARTVRGAIDSSEVFSSTVPDSVSVAEACRNIKSGDADAMYVGAAGTFLLLAAAVNEGVWSKR